MESKIMEKKFLNKSYLISNKYKDFFDRCRVHRIKSNEKLPIRSKLDLGSLIILLYTFKIHFIY